jgi:alkaline phosphatase
MCCSAAAPLFSSRGGSRRQTQDGKDIIAAFRGKGWQVVTNTPELKAATGARLIGLFADEDQDFDIESDRAKGRRWPRMTAGALKALSQASRIALSC